MKFRAALRLLAPLKIPLNYAIAYFSSKNLATLYRIPVSLALGLLPVQPKLERALLHPAARVVPRVGLVPVDDAVVVRVRTLAVEVPPKEPAERAEAERGCQPQRPAVNRDRSRVRVVAVRGQLVHGDGLEAAQEDEKEGDVPVSVVVVSVGVRVTVS